MHVLIAGPFARISDHEIRLLASALAAGQLVIIDSPQETTTQNLTCSSTEFLSSLQNIKSCGYDDEVIIESHINGDLRYLYRPPILHNKKVVQWRHPLRQPCWRRGRWKSLT